MNTEAADEGVEELEAEDPLGEARDEQHFEVNRRLCGKSSILFRLMYEKPKYRDEDTSADQIALKHVDTDFVPISVFISSRGNA